MEWRFYRRSHMLEVGSQIDSNVEVSDGSSNGLIIDIGERTIEIFESDLNQAPNPAAQTLATRTSGVFP